MKKLFAMLLTFSLLVAALCAPGLAESKAVEDLVIGVVPKSLSHPYYQEVQKGAEKVEEEYGCTILWTGTTEESVDGQIAVVEDLVAQEVDIIVIAVCDSAALKGAIDDAIDEGVQVWTFDIDAPDSERIGCGTACNPEESGEAIAHSLAASIGEEGQVAILTGGLGQEVLNRRVDAIRATLSAEYPNVEIVAVESGEGDTEKNISITENLLQEYPDLKGIAGVSTECVPAAASVVMETGSSVKVTGVAMPSACAEYVDAGIIDEIILWDPQAEVYAPIVAAINYYMDGTFPQNGDEFGWAGSIVIDEEDDPTTFYVSSIIFDASNIHDYDF